MPSPIATTLTLESRFLRVALTVEIAHAHPEFFVESHLSDLRKNAEELLPAALASEGPPALRRVLESVEGLLIRRSSDDLARCTPLNIDPPTAERKPAEPMADAPPSETLACWLGHIDEVRTLAPDFTAAAWTVCTNRARPIYGRASLPRCHPDMRELLANSATTLSSMRTACSGCALSQKPDHSITAA